MKSIRRYLPLAAVVLSIPLVHAQSGFDIAVGFGAIQDKASKTTVDQNLQNCVPNDPAPPCVATPSLSQFMIGVSGDLMLWKRFGVGAEVNFEPSKQDYINLNASAAANGLNTLSVQSRMTLFDFNGILQPVKTKKVGVKLEGGIGGANLKFYQGGSSSSVLGSQNFSQYFQSSNHFQVHGGAGVQIYVTEHMFIRPQFDVHYVHNLTEFGRNVVTEETVWLGYTFGGQ